MEAVAATTPIRGTPRLGAALVAFVAAFVAASCSRRSKPAEIAADPSASTSSAPHPGPATLSCPSTHPQGCALWARVPRDGGAPEIFDVDEGLSGPIVVSDDAVITVSNGVATRIVRRPKSAPSDARPLSWPGGTARSMVLADDAVVVSTEGVIVSVPVDGGPSRAVIKTLDPYILAVHGSNVAWTDEYDAGVADVFVAPLGKGAAKRAARREVDPYAVALDDDGLWWGTYDDTPKLQAIRVLRSGAAYPETLVDAQDQILAIATDATDVLWISFVDGKEPIVRRASKKAGPAIEVARGLATMRNDRFVHRLVVDGDAVWFSDRASVLRAPKSGGPAHVMASVRGEIASFDVDADALWVAAFESPP